MNRDQGTPAMSHDDEPLRALLHDAVSDVAPRDGLADVRRRTRPRRTSRSRRWTPVLVGAGAVAATVVAGTVLVSSLGDDRGREADTPAASETEAASFTAGIYFVGETPTGPRLYREFQRLPARGSEAESVLTALERLAISAGPEDPDYRTLWPSASFAGVSLEEDRIVVEVGNEAALQQSEGAGLGQLGVQQAVYTAEAVLGEALPVAFEWQGKPARKVLGARVPAVVERDRLYAVTAPVNISDPAEGLLVEDTFTARGTMASYVDEVRWRLTANGGVVLEGTAPASDVAGPDATATLGAPGWEAEVDVSGLDPGDYVLEVEVTDTGQTSDTPASFNDTRTVTVR
jgi:hypothetical protein